MSPSGPCIILSMPLGPSDERSVRDTVLAAKMFALMASVPRTRDLAPCSCGENRPHRTVLSVWAGGGRGGGQHAPARPPARLARDACSTLGAWNGTAVNGCGTMMWWEGPTGSTQPLRYCESAHARLPLGGGCELSRRRDGRPRALRARPPGARRAQASHWLTRMIMKGRPYSSKAKDMAAALGSLQPGAHCRPRAGAWSSARTT